MSGQHPRGTKLAARIVPGFVLKDVLHTGERFIVYRGRRSKDGERVLIKLATSAKPDTDTIRQLKSEFEFGAAIHLDCALRPVEWLEKGPSTGIVFEDLGGLTLPLLDMAEDDRDALIGACLAVARAVACLHTGHLSHGHLTPYNVLYARDQDRAYVMGIDQDNGPADGPRDTVVEPLEQSFLAPEQFDEVSDTADHRADLYALGGIMYFLACGYPPCEPKDDHELIHYILAREPGRLDEIARQWGKPLQQIIKHLLQKTPDDRYQDIAEVIQALHAARGADGADPDAADAAPENATTRFRFPDELYGRNQEIAQLQDAHQHQLSGEPQWVMLLGQAGIGKTSLVRGIAKQISDGYFIQGKFEQLHRHVPYQALIEALGQLVTQLLTEPDSRLHLLRHRIHETLGGNTRLLLEVLPDLAAITGEFPALDSLPPAESKRRFETAVRSFVSLFAREDESLILFLDDLQWVDAASLQLLLAMATDPGLQRLFLIAAYRDNEISAMHPLAAALDQLSASGVEIRRVAIHPLDEATVAHFVADTLHEPVDKVEPLAAWISQQTLGNPFFVRQLLSTLREHQLIRPCGDAQGWQWDMADIANSGLSGDIGQFMTQKLQQLPDRTQDMLSVAACLGNVFRPDELRQLLDTDEATLRTQLAQTRAAQLTTPVESDGNPLAGAWQFAHDRVQQTAFNMMPAERRLDTHLAIAQWLETQGHGRNERRLFELANHYNEAKSLASGAKDRQRRAEINLAAGKRAKASAAYEAALGYFDEGLSCLDPTSWQSDYALTLQLHIEAAECHYWCGERDTAERLFGVIIDKARNRTDKARAYAIKVTLSISEGNPKLGLALGAECLAMFDIHLPHDTDDLKTAVQEALEEADQVVADYDVARLLQREKPDGDSYAIVSELLLRLYPAGYQLGPQTLIMVTMKTVVFALRYGDNATTAFALVNYGMVLGSFLGDYQNGERFARMALELSEHVHEPALLTKIYYVYGAMVGHWTQPARGVTKILHKAYNQALEAADLVYAGLNVSFLFRGHLLQGDNLDDILRDWQAYEEAVQRLQYPLITETFRLMRQWILALKGRTASPTTLTDEHYDEAAMLRFYEATPAKSPLHWFNFLRAQLAYFMGDADRAKTLIDAAHEHIDAIFGQFAVPEHILFRCLILIDTLPADHPAQQQRVEAIRNGREQLQHFARHAPDNHGHRLALVDAEMARAEDRADDAMESYEQAISLAERHGFQQHAALAHERAARFYQQRNLQGMARVHMNEAHYGYLRWGATAKANDLRQRYPELLTGAITPGEEDRNRAGSERGIQEIPTALSMRMLAVCKDMHLDVMLEKLLELTLNEAGATRGLIVLRRGEQWMVEVAAGEDHPRILQATPLERFQACAQSLIQFVRRTGKLMVLDDARHDATFAKDPYVKNKDSRSLLCCPIQINDECLALIYLENPLLKAAFSAYQQTLVSWIAEHSADAIHNAMRYEDLRKQVGERKRAEQIAQEGERRWRAFLENTQLAVVSLDLEGCVNYINPYLAGLAGYDAEDLIGKNWFQEMLPKRYRRNDIQKHFYDLLHDQPHSYVRGVVRTHDNRERYIAWSNSWVRDPDGMVIGTVSIGSDITEQLNAERQIRRLNRDLERRVEQRTQELSAVNQELEAFAYSISHDLRAPLRTIDGFSQALAEDYEAQLDDDGKDYLERVRRAAKRMGGMIDATLTMSRSTRGAIERADIDLSDMSREILAELAEREPQRQVATHIQSGIYLHADPRLMHIVMDNLLGNAWKYSAKNPEAEIHIVATFSSGHQIVTVRDNGAGFDMKFANKLFSAFQRMHNDADFEGSGIGLATVKRILNRHGGSIWAEAAPGEGASFHFTVDAPSLGNNGD